MQSKHAAPMLEEAMTSSTMHGVVKSSPRPRGSRVGMGRVWEAHKDGVVLILAMKAWDHYKQLV